MRLDTLPTTNLRIAVSVALAVVYVLVMLGGAVAGRPIDAPTADTIAKFLLAMMVADVVQFGWKRATHKPDTPPSTTAKRLGGFTSGRVPDDLPLSNDPSSHPASSR